MLQTPCRIRPFLDENAVAYEVIRHRADFTAPETAQDTHTPGREFAKTVVVRVDGAFALAVLPANLRLDLEKLRHTLGARNCSLVDETEMAHLFPDCEVGAEPPFGALYGLPVYLDAAFEGHEQLTFNAGSHDEVIRIAYADYVSLARPRILAMSTSRRAI